MSSSQKKIRDLERLKKKLNDEIDKEKIEAINTKIEELKQIKQNNIENENKLRVQNKINRRLKNPNPTKVCLLIFRAYHIIVDMYALSVCYHTSILYLFICVCNSLNPQINLLQVLLKLLKQGNERKRIVKIQTVLIVQ